MDIIVIDGMLLSTETYKSVALELSRGAVVPSFGTYTYPILYPDNPSLGYFRDVD